MLWLTFYVCNNCCTGNLRSCSTGRRNGDEDRFFHQSAIDSKVDDSFGRIDRRATAKGNDYIRLYLCALIQPVSHHFCGGIRNCLIKHLDPATRVNRIDYSLHASVFRHKLITDDQNRFVLILAQIFHGLFSGADFCFNIHVWHTHSLLCAFRFVFLSECWMHQTLHSGVFCRRNGQRLSPLRSVQRS